jgi:hypothetical protein
MERPTPDEVINAILEEVFGKKLARRIKRRSRARASKI